MDMKPVSYRLDELPKPTPEQLAAIKRLEAMPDDQIDTSDAPEVTTTKWADATCGRCYRPLKQQVTARLDADVLAWLKSGGRGYAPSQDAALEQASFGCT